MYPGSVLLLLCHSGGISVSRVCYGRIVLSFCVAVFIFYLLVISQSQNRIRVPVWFPYSETAVTSSTTFYMTDIFLNLYEIMILKSKKKIAHCFFTAF